VVVLLKKKTPPDCARVVSNIEICLDSLSQLLNDLLDISKLEAGVVTPHVTDIAVADLFAKMLSVHATEAELKGLRLRLRPSTYVGLTDSQLFQRILSNLLANAIRYTESGGVLVGCRRYKGKQWIEVWDTGIGIDADKTGIIFEEFRQLGDTSRNRGSGLGLAIVAKTAALLGLEIRLRSRPGRGSMFAIELPVGRATQAVTSPATQAVARSLKIALVDDNSQVLDALTAALEGEGHEVIAATSGIVLIGNLGDRVPDIVISDYRLTKGETGFNVIAALRRIFGKALPAILITGDTNPELVRSMVRRGIAVLHKPLQMDALNIIIRDATERKEP